MLTDVDGDGDLDVLGFYSVPVPQEAVSRVFLWLNDGDGRFEAVPGRIPGPSPSVAIQDFASGDIDADGDPDLVIGVFGTPILLLNDGAGSFRDASDQVASESFDVETVDLGDLDGDGDLDLFIANRIGGPVVIRLYEGGRFVEAPPAWSDPETELRQFTQQVLIRDLDLDGDTDLFLVNFVFVLTENVGNRLLINTGDGLVDESPSRIAGFGALTRLRRTSEALAGDLDQDGDLDLLLIDVAGPRLLLNDGEGRFEDAADELMPEIPDFR